MSAALQFAAVAPVKPAIGYLSIAAPAYNEEAGIVAVLDGWLDHLRNCREVERFEVVVCNDGSHDATGSLLNAKALVAAELRPVHLKLNRGAAVALSTAIQHTRGDWVLLIDSDGQFPIAELEKLAAAVHANGVPAAIGVRVAKKDGPFSRFGSWASGAICNWCHGTRYRDFNSAFKLVDGSLLRSLHLEARGLNYSTEITSRLLERGVRPVEVEIAHLPRAHGKSSLNFLRGARDRLLFVAYIALRQLLLRLRILERPDLWV